MVWINLLIAALFEIAWAIGLKYSDGFSQVIPSVFTVITMILSFVFLGFAAKNLPIGTAYAVWTGIGTAGTAILGIILFNEPKDFIRIIYISMIITGAIGLKFHSELN